MNPHIQSTPKIAKILEKEAKFRKRAKILEKERKLPKRAQILEKLPKRPKKLKKNLKKSKNFGKELTY